MDTPLKIVTPIGMVGYGFDPAKMYEGIRMGAKAVICDSGSTDSGPQKLGLGYGSCPHEAYVHDLGLLVDASYHTKVKVLIGSAGGDGSNEHVDQFIQIIQEHCEKNKYRMKVVKIYAGIDKDLICEAIDAGKITPCGVVPELTKDDVKAATRIVAQMGLEPYVEAMKEVPDFDIIIGGRAYDPSPYAAWCVANGVTDLGVAYHMGKVMECGAQCGTPKSKEALATVWKDRFEVLPLQKNAICTRQSLAAHSLYENGRADVHPGPGGTLDITTTTFYEAGDRAAGAKGQIFHVADPYTIKLEGARILGYRTVVPGSFRDRILVAQIDPFLEKIRKYLKTKFPDTKYELGFRVYGRDGTMGPLETDKTLGKELFVLAEIVADTQAIANRVAALTRVALVHSPYPGQKCTAGNFAMPITPLEIPLGAVCCFNVYHLLPVADPKALFPRHALDLGVAEGEQIERNSEFGSQFGELDVTLMSGLEATRNGQINGHANGQTNGHADGHINGDGGGKFDLSGKASGTIPLTSLAKVIRSKNAGPFEVTFDIIFNDEESLAYAKRSPQLTAENIAMLYQIDVKDVITCQFFEPAYAFKATIPRPWPAGAFGDRDIHCSQQHTPLLDMMI